MGRREDWTLAFQSTLNGLQSHIKICVGSTELTGYEGHLSNQMLKFSVEGIAYKPSLMHRENFQTRSSDFAESKILS